VIKAVVKNRAAVIQDIIGFNSFIALLSDHALSNVFYPACDYKKLCNDDKSIRDERLHPLHPNSKTKRKFSKSELENIENIQKERIAAHWMAIKGHDIWIRKIASYCGQVNELKKHFQKKLKRGGEYAHPYAEFLLYGIVAKSILFMLTPSIEEPSSVDKNAAINHADKVLKDIKEKLIGFGFNETIKTYQLIQLIEGYKLAISESMRKKAEKTDKTKRMRQLVQVITIRLLDVFGEVSPSILKSIASFAGSTLEDRAVENYIKKAKEEYSEKLSSDPLYRPRRITAR